MRLTELSSEEVSLVSGGIKIGRTFAVVGSAVVGAVAGGLATGGNPAGIAAGAAAGAAIGVQATKPKS